MSIVQFPMDNGKLWEQDLEKIICQTPCVNFITGTYTASLKRLCGWIQPEEVEEETRIFKELMAVGRTNVESFINFANKHRDSVIVSGLELYLTPYTNELFRYICGSNMTIDDIFSDYKDMGAHSTNVAIRFVLNIINQVITDLVNINESVTAPIEVSEGWCENMLYMFYYIKIAFRVIPGFTWQASMPTTTYNERDVCLTVAKNSPEYNRFKELVDGAFINRSVRLYLSGKDNFKPIRQIIVYQTLSDDYNVRLF